MLNEKWVPVRGYEDAYQVSDRGRVRSVRRIVMRSNGIPQLIAERVLSEKRTTNNYPIVSLYRGGSRKQVYVHHLVAEHFIGERPNGLFVLHKDDNKKNNSVSNLYYGTCSENANDAYSNGRDMGARRGSEHPDSVLSKEDIPNIRALADSGHSQRHIAIAFGVSKGTIAAVLQGRTWRWVA